ncbi:unnamed protein product [Symbiodinium natans]|uniref:Uncharacterized protein n=1 Tax=Symbiodinium natans TaxID=878477 RepID=A0A812J6V6_9DINO|nr:unnamed protein product [Symbiodinium natans]
MGKFSAKKVSASGREPSDSGVVLRKPAAQQPCGKLISQARDAGEKHSKILSDLRNFRALHKCLPARNGTLAREDTLARAISMLRKSWPSLDAEVREGLTREFADVLDGALSSSRRDLAVLSALEEGAAFHLQHGRHARRGREAVVRGEDALAQRIQRAVANLDSFPEVAIAHAAFLESWHAADACAEMSVGAAEAALEEGAAFHLQHGRHARRGREAVVRGEDALARRIQRAVANLDSFPELAIAHAAFLESWHAADACAEMSVGAAEAALEEGAAFHLQHGRHARRGREAVVRGEDALAQRIQRAVANLDSFPELAIARVSAQLKPLWRKVPPFICSMADMPAVDGKRLSVVKMPWRGGSSRLWPTWILFLNLRSRMLHFWSPGTQQTFFWTQQKPLWRKVPPFICSMADMPAVDGKRLSVVKMPWRSGSSGLWPTWILFLNLRSHMLHFWSPGTQQTFFWTQQKPLWRKVPPFICSMADMPAVDGKRLSVVKMPWRSGSSGLWPTWIFFLKLRSHMLHFWSPGTQQMHVQR